MGMIMKSGVVHRLARGGIDDHCHGISPRYDFTMRLGKRYYLFTVVTNQKSNAQE